MQIKYAAQSSKAPAAKHNSHEALIFAVRFWGARWHDGAVMPCIGKVRYINPTCNDMCGMSFAVRCLQIVWLVLHFAWCCLVLAGVACGGQCGMREYVFPFCCSSRKLAEVPLALAKWRGGWNLQSHETQAVWLSLKPPPGTRSACRHRQQIRQHPHSQHHSVFMQSSLPS